MAESKVEICGGFPALCIKGEKVPACAYITYFEERGDHKLFSENGFDLFSLSVSTATQPINSSSGFTPYIKGVFDNKSEPDFSYIDKCVDNILSSNKTALIFPRIYVCMPQWWIDENPEHTIPVPHGKRRESLYSPKFRSDGAEMVNRLIQHFRSFHAKDNIIGYQISGGNTQEWFHLDLKGGYDDTTVPFFNDYLKANRPCLYPASRLPSLSELEGNSPIKDELLKAFLRFSNDEVAKTVDYLCAAAKKACENEQIVGVFSGYCAEVGDPLWGTHSLNKLLESPHIDFFSSPNSYFNMRTLGEDWADMMPVDSIKLHEKMCFIECDIRTMLTLSPEKSRKGSDPLHYYSESVWSGPPTEDLSVFAVRKSLARQLCHKHGLWWFDMFGHWFSSEKLMNEMRLSKSLYQKAIMEERCDHKNEVAVFIDESLFSSVGKGYPSAVSVSGLRRELGFCGIPYSLFLLSDFSKINWENESFKAVVFCDSENTDLLEKCKNKLSSLGIRYLKSDKDKPKFTADELMSFFKDSGIFVYSESKDVFYIGGGFVSIHASDEGEKLIRFPEKLLLRDVHTNEIFSGSEITLNLRKFETRIFEIEKI